VPEDRWSGRTGVLTPPSYHTSLANLRFRAGW
jgi:hypothetical protein